MPGISAVTASQDKGSLLVAGGRIFRKIYNGQATARTFGMPVAFECASTHTTQMETVIQPTTGTLNHFAGVVCNPDNVADTTYSIANHAWGWVCCYGACECYLEGTSAILAGQPLKCVNAQNYMVKAQAADTKSNYKQHAIAIDAYAVGSAALKTVFVHAV